MAIFTRPRNTAEAQKMLETGIARPADTWEDVWRTMTSPLNADPWADIAAPPMTETQQIEANLKANLTARAVLPPIMTATEISSSTKRSLTAVDRILADDGVRQYTEHLQQQLDQALKNEAAAQMRLFMTERHLARLEARLGDDNPGSHDYHGTTDIAGSPVPDPVHERFHKSIGDVLAGNVIPKAREQMQDALNRAPKPANATGASTDKPMPRGAVAFSHQKIGTYLP